jgi:hypothetical protein
MKRLAFVLVVCTLLSVPAMAGLTMGDVVQVAYVDTSPGVVVNVVTPPHTGNVIAGINNIVVDGQARQGFCIEYKELASTSLLPYTVEALEDAPLPGPAMGSAQAMDIMKVWSWWKASDGSALSAAIAQCTVWEIRDDGNFLTGDFQLNTASVRTSAEGLLASLPGLTDYTEMIGLTNSGKQGYGIPVVPPVPAPGAILLAGLGASLVGHLRRRKAI